MGVAQQIGQVVPVEAVAFEAGLDFVATWDRLGEIKLKYLVQDVDRHGNVRSYVRLRGKPKIRIRGIPGGAEFMLAYQVALSGTDDHNKERQRYRAPAQGSFGSVCLAYYASEVFKRLRETTPPYRVRLFSGPLASGAFWQADPARQ